MLTRRFLMQRALLPLAGLALATRADAGSLFQNAGLRGSLDEADQVVMPDGGETGSLRFAKALKEAAARGRPVFLPPGTYRVSGLDLPDNTEINGVAGRSRIEYTGDGHLFRGTNLKRVRLSGITIDGGNRWLADDAGGLLHFIGVERLEIENCEIVGASRNALQLEGCGGEIRENRISGAADAGIYAVESAMLAIRDNLVSGCGNGGILVHRYKPGEDGTIITGNRVSGILSRGGGTGQNGNGINIFRAGNVIISGNHVQDCAFSAIRANAASGVQISANQCLRSGETAVYCEFGFEGATITGNMIDGAANGISVVNFNEGGRLATISGNIVRNIDAPAPYPPTDAGFGIGIAVEADTVISGNAIDGVAKWGLLLGWGPYLRNMVATGNMIRDVPVGCAVSVAEGAGSALIADNVFSETPDGAVAAFRWAKKASGDLAVDGNDGFEQLTVEKNRLT